MADTAAGASWSSCSVALYAGDAHRVASGFYDAHLQEFLQCTDVSLLKKRLFIRATAVDNVLAAFLVVP